MSMVIQIYSLYIIKTRILMLIHMIIISHIHHQNHDSTISHFFLSGWGGI